MNVAAALTELYKRQTKLEELISLSNAEELHGAKDNSESWCDELEKINEAVKILESI